MGENESCYGQFKSLWERYCPCRLMRKNIVMMTLTLLCFALVTWTVIATRGEEVVQSNITYVMIDDSKEVYNLNFTLSTVMTKEKAKAKLAKEKDKINKSLKVKKSVFRHIRNPENENTMCKCMCALNVTRAQIVWALQYFQNNNLTIPVSEAEGAEVVSDGNGGEADDISAAEGG